MFVNVASIQLVIIFLGPRASLRGLPIPRPFPFPPSMVGQSEGVPGEVESCEVRRTSTGWEDDLENLIPAEAKGNTGETHQSPIV